MTEENEVIETNEAEKRPERLFTQDELTRIAAKEARKAENSILKTLEIESKDELQSILELIKTAKESQNISGDLENARRENAQLTAKLAAVEQREYLKNKGIADEDIPLYQAYISQLVKDSNANFNEAADEYLKTRPKKPDKVPASAVFGGTGINPITPTEAETLKSCWETAKKEKNHAEMSRLIRLAQSKGCKIN